MSLRHTIRGFAWLVVAGSLAWAPVSMKGQTPALQPAVAPSAQSASAPHPIHRAEVTYSNGVLQVVADDSSLNQILRTIAQQTGMKITGGVSDERVFGKYGPAAPGQVLSSLLDGTGSNMLLVQTAQNAPAELILTPRQGGPTPPNPNASQDEEYQPPRSQQMASPYPSPPMQPPNPPLPGVAAPGMQAPNTNSPASASGQTTSAPDTQGLPPSPNGVKTPQQIYQELQLLRQQQQQPAAPQ